MDIIVRPVVTEKMNAQADGLKKYGFIVDKKANKVQIKRAVENLYGVTVESVNTMFYAGKRKARFTRTGYVAGRRNAFKKAVITLREGDTIDFYSNI
ncbi:MAG: 50S ribosomal protein L23 [Bacteroidales bacterium]|jgi:large subunit ribosomal protein L23|nr:50S ribosomal protein L23 [Bacteroidales bacterium]